MSFTILQLVPAPAGLVARYVRRGTGEPCGELPVHYLALCDHYYGENEEKTSRAIMGVIAGYDLCVGFAVCTELQDFDGPAMFAGMFFKNEPAPATS